MVHKEILLSPQFLFITRVCYYNLQNQNTKVTDNVGYINELIIHDPAFKVTAMLGGSTMSGSQL